MSFKVQKNKAGPCIICSFDIQLRIQNQKMKKIICYVIICSWMWSNNQNKQKKNGSQDKFDVNIKMIWFLYPGSNLLWLY